MNYRNIAILTAYLFTWTGGAALAASASENSAFTGAYIEARSGVEAPHATDPQGNEVNTTLQYSNAFVPGIAGGYDFSIGDSSTLGVYVEADKSSLKILDDAGNFLSGNSNFSAGLKLGQSIGPKSQIYLKAGYNKFSYDIDGLSVNKSGPSIGGGLNYILISKFYIGTEVNYGFFGTVDTYNSHGAYAGSYALSRLEALVKVGIHF